MKIIHPLALRAWLRHCLSWLRQPSGCLAWLSANYSWQPAGFQRQLQPPRPHGGLLTQDGMPSSCGHCRGQSRQRPPPETCYTSTTSRRSATTSTGAKRPEVGPESAGRPSHSGAHRSTEGSRTDAERLAGPRHRVGSWTSLTSLRPTASAAATAKATFRERVVRARFFVLHLLIRSTVPPSSCWCHQRSRE